MVSPIHDAADILDQIECAVRHPRRPTPYRIDFYCDLGHKSKTAHARAWIDDMGKVGIVCFNDASHNRPLWETLVKPNQRGEHRGIPPEPEYRPDGSCPYCGLFNGAHDPGHPAIPDVPETWGIASKRRSDGKYDLVPYLHPALPAKPARDPCPGHRRRMFLERQEQYERDLKEWDDLCAAIARDEGRPIPWPRELPGNLWDPPPAMRFHHLPEWARRALAAAQKEMP